jgi:hypothetical protein
MKVVLDTNILVAGLYSKRGASYYLVKAALSGELAFALSPLLALEYEGILNQKIEVMTPGEFLHHWRNKHESIIHTSHT